MIPLEHLRRKNLFEKYTYRSFRPGCKTLGKAYGNFLNGKRSINKTMGFSKNSIRQIYYTLREHAQLAQAHYFSNSMLKAVIESAYQVNHKQYSIQEKKVFQKVAAYKKSLNDSTEMVSYEVFGSDKKEKVSVIVQRDAVKERWGQFIYLLLKKIGPEKVLEVGTNLGVSGSYILEALSTVESFFFLSMEGNPQFCNIANKQFGNIAPRQHFEIIQGLYDDTFPRMLKRKIPFDVLFIDGNHHKEPTISYFEALRKVSSATNSLFVFDDICYNGGMKEAWQYIKGHEEVNFSVDMGRMGLVVFEEGCRVKNKNFNLPLFPD